MNLFMMCETLDRRACAPLPDGYTFDLCREDELDIWMAFPFDSPAQAAEYRPFMEQCFRDIYQPQRDEFFRRCLFVRDASGKPVATGFTWLSYGRVYTLQWIKTLPECEGKGIGRALISRLMTDLPDDAYPVYLHTHPECLRALHLYTDFGFRLLTDPRIGYRDNDLQTCLPILQQGLTPAAWKSLRYAEAPCGLLEAALSSQTEDF